MVDGLPLITRDLLRSYAPTGKLRAALNFGNRVLVGRDGAGRASGISVDLARRLAVDLGLELQFVEFERAVDVSSAARDNLWDICFLAVDPERCADIDFTEPYVKISGCYLINVASQVAHSTEVVPRKLRIGAVEGSAYTLHLSRRPGAEKLVSFVDIRAALAAFDRGEVDGIAGIEQAMVEEALLRRDATVLQPPFMTIAQAIGVPAGHRGAIQDLRCRLAALARSGAIATILERYGVPAENPVVPN